MDYSGLVVVYAYTSDARIPVEGAVVTVAESLSPGAAVYAVEKTDRSGYIRPVRIPAPAFSQSQTPGNGVPFATVSIRIAHPGYDREDNSGVQVFPNTVTVQSFQLQPAAQNLDQSISFTTPPQNL